MGIIYPKNLIVIKNASRSIHVTICQTRLGSQLWSINRPFDFQVSVYLSSAGQVGYVVTGMRRTQEALIGDTFCSPAKAANPLPGFRRPKPMVRQWFLETALALLVIYRNLPEFYKTISFQKMPALFC